VTVFAGDADPRRQAARPLGCGPSVSARPRIPCGLGQRTEIMPRLSDTQSILLPAAAARRDFSVLPPPDT